MASFPTGLRLPYPTQGHEGIQVAPVRALPQQEVRGLRKPPCPHEPEAPLSQRGGGRPAAPTSATPRLKQPAQEMASLHGLSSSPRSQSSQGHQQKGFGHRKPPGHSGAESPLLPRRTREVSGHVWRGYVHSHCPANTASPSTWDDTTTSHQKTLGLGKSLLFLSSISRDK